MLDITIISIGKLKEKYYLQASNEYLKRLKPYAKIKMIELPALSFSVHNKEDIRKKESQKIEKYIQNNHLDNIYLLSESGQEFDSIELATWLNSNYKLNLVIAGSLGFSHKMSDKYPKISLSKLTFPHELARVVLLEQLYRAVSILNNKTYHY